jgi:hypothetical protein
MPNETLPQQAYLSEYDAFGIRTPASLLAPTSPGNSAGMKNVVGGPVSQSTQAPVSPSGNIQSSQAMGYNTGIGWWMGFDGGTPKFFLGNAAGNKVTWDGSTLSITGNFTIGSLWSTAGPGDNLQTAVNTLSAAGGGILYLKSGTFTQSSNLTVPSSVSIVGVSPTSSIINFNSTSAHLIYAGSSVYTTGTITSITFGVNVTGSGTLWLANVTAGQSLFLGTRWYTIAAVTSNTTLILAEGYGDNVTLPSAYRISSIVTDVLLQNVGLQNSTGTAAVFTDCRRITFNNVLFVSNNVGYSITNASEVVKSRVGTFASTSDGFQCTNVGFCNWNSVNSNSNGGNGATLNNVKNLALLPGSANGNTGDGYNLTTVVNSVFLVEASSNGGKGMTMVLGCTNVDVYSGDVQNNTSDGIKLTASAMNCHIWGISITGNGGYGINIVDSTSTNNSISTNNFSTNASGALNDIGTGTIVRGNSGLSDNTNGNAVSFSSYGGDGSDGAVTISSPTTLTRDMYYTNLTVNISQTLTTAGYRIFCTGTLTVNGTIDWSGKNGGAGVTNGAGGVGGAALVDGYLKGSPIGSAGGGGDTGSGSSGIIGSSIANSLGTNGVAGGASVDNAAGGAGTATASLVAPILLWNVSTMLDITATGATIKYSGSANSGGGAGAGQSGGAGGQGGSGGGSASNGGTIAIYARNITISATGIISSKGGVGGAGGVGTGSGSHGGGGGGGGQGGQIILIYVTLTNSGSITAAAGAGGTGGAGVGANGFAGTTGTVGKVRQYQLS